MNLIGGQLLQPTEASEAISLCSRNPLALARGGSQNHIVDPLSKIKNNHANTSSTLKSQSVPKVQGYWGRVLGLSDNDEIPDLKVSNHYESVKNEDPEENFDSLKEEVSALKQQVKALNKSLAISRQELFSE